MIICAFVALDFLALQRYFSYCAILVAIVLQNYLAFVSVGYRTLIARYVTKWGIARACAKPTTKGGIAPFSEGPKGGRRKGGRGRKLSHFRSAVPSVVVWSILLVSLSGVKKKL